MGNIVRSGTNKTHQSIFFTCFISFNSWRAGAYVSHQWEKDSVPSKQVADTPKKSNLELPVNLNMDVLDRGKEPEYCWKKCTTHKKTQLKSFWFLNSRHNYTKGEDLCEVDFFKNCISCYYLVKDIALIILCNRVQLPNIYTKQICAVQNDYSVRVPYQWNEIKDIYTMEQAKVNIPLLK